MSESEGFLKKNVQRLIDRYYPYVGNGLRYRDGTQPFYSWVLESIDAGTATVLNVGAGPTPQPNRSMKGKVHRLLGVDPDPCVLDNRDLDEAYINDGLHLPFDDEKFDAVYSDWTVEHVEHPIPFLAEINRVLKPRGLYLFRTVNLHHYVTAISYFTPQWFHKLIANRVRALSNEHHDPWPTFYRMNTRRALARILPQAGFDRYEIRMIESYPSYLLFNSCLFRTGVAYERIVNTFSSLATFRQIVLVKAVRRG